MTDGRTTDRPLTPFGAWLAREMERRDITRPEFSRRAGWPANRLAMYLRDNVPTAPHILTIARVLGCRVETVVRAAAGVTPIELPVTDVAAEIAELAAKTPDDRLQLVLAHLQAIQREAAVR